jgi:hypothetical protein
MRMGSSHHVSGWDTASTWASVGYSQAVAGRADETGSPASALVDNDTFYRYFQDPNPEVTL